MQIVTLVTDFGTSDTYVALNQSFAIWINECQLDWRWCASYGFASAHAPIALIGSNGYLELALTVVLPPEDSICMSVIVLGYASDFLVRLNPRAA